MLYFSDTLLSTVYMQNIHLKKGKKKTKNPEVTDMSGFFWKELRLPATLTGAGNCTNLTKQESVQFSLVLLFKGRKSSAYNQLNNYKKRMLQVSLKLFQTGGFSIKTALAAICQEISGVDRMTLVHQPELWQAKNVSYVRVSTWKLVVKVNPTSKSHHTMFYRLLRFLQDHHSQNKNCVFQNSTKQHKNINHKNMVKNFETVHRAEVENLSCSCSENNLKLNVSHNGL